MSNGQNTQAEIKRKAVDGSDRSAGQYREIGISAVAAALAARSANARPARGPAPAKLAPATGK